MTPTPRAPHINLRAAIALNAVLIGFASLPVIDFLRHDPSPASRERERELSMQIPYLAGWRDMRGILFLTDRAVNAPWHYLVGHILPALVWCCLIPFQHMQSFRRDHPRLHRIFGRAVLASNVVLIVTGVLFHPRKLSFTHENTWHLHWGWLPTFTVGSNITAVLQGWTLWKTYTAARRKDIAKHRKWAVLYTVAGSIIAMQRVGIVIVEAFAWSMAYVPASIRSALLTTPQHLEDIVSGEMGAFSLTTWAAMVAAAVWATHIMYTSRGGSLTRKSL
ncbi:unnamed protein product [Parajaminaea phylloscopi]